jgi:hypothetical protein
MASRSFTATRDVKTVAIVSSSVVNEYVLLLAMSKITVNGKYTFSMKDGRIECMCSKYDRRVRTSAATKLRTAEGSAARLRSAW